MDKLYITTNDGSMINLKVVANASANKIEIENNYYKVRIKAPAVDNKANSELVKFLAKLLNISKSSIQITHGEKSSRKTIFLKNYFINTENFFEDT